MACKNRTTLILLAALWSSCASAQVATPDQDGLDQWFIQNATVTALHIKLTPSASEHQQELENILNNIQTKPKSIEDILWQKSLPENTSFPVEMAAKDNFTALKDAALQLLGIPYKYGGNTPETGFDCSGFVRYVFNELGHKNLPRRSKDLSNVGEVIAESNIKEGDLVFFNTLGRKFSHVGIYIGDDQFIHAPSSGGQVRIEKINSYWKKRYNGARRII